MAVFVFSASHSARTSSIPIVSDGARSLRSCELERCHGLKFYLLIVKHQTETGQTKRTAQGKQARPSANLLAIATYSRSSSVRVGSFRCTRSSAAANVVAIFLSRQQIKFINNKNQPKRSKSVGSGGRSMLGAGLLGGLVPSSRDGGWAAAAGACATRIAKLKQSCRSTRTSSLFHRQKKTRQEIDRGSRGQAHGDARWCVLGLGPP